MRFLVARMIYIDGLATLFAFGGIYAAGTFDMTESEVLTFGIALNVAVMRTVLLGGEISRRLRWPHGRCAFAALPRKGGHLHTIDDLDETDDDVTDARLPMVKPLPANIEETSLNKIPGRRRPWRPCARHAPRPFRPRPLGRWHVGCTFVNS